MVNYMDARKEFMIIKKTYIYKAFFLLDDSWAYMFCQEFAFQGHQMVGPLGRLVAAGSKGAHSGNIQRDMMRTVQDLQGFQHVHGDVPWHQWMKKNKKHMRSILTYTCLINNITWT